MKKKKKAAKKAQAGAKAKVGARASASARSNSNWQQVNILLGRPLGLPGVRASPYMPAG